MRRGNLGEGGGWFLIANEMREGVRKEVYLYCKGQENRFTAAHLKRAEPGAYPPTTTAEYLHVFEKQAGLSAMVAQMFSINAAL